MGRMRIRAYVNKLDTSEVFKDLKKELEDKTAN